MWMRRTMEASSGASDEFNESSHIGSPKSFQQQASAGDWKSKLVENGQWIGSKVIDMSGFLRRNSHTSIPDGPTNDGRANWMADIRNCSNPKRTPSNSGHANYPTFQYQNDFQEGHRPGAYSDTRSKESTNVLVQKETRQRKKKKKSKKLKIYDSSASDRSSSSTSSEEEEEEQVKARQRTKKCKKKNLPKKKKKSLPKPSPTFYSSSEETGSSDEEKENQHAVNHETSESEAEEIKPKATKKAKKKIKAKTPKTIDVEDLLGVENEIEVSHHLEKKSDPQTESIQDLLFGLEFEPVLTESGNHPVCPAALMNSNPPMIQTDPRPSLPNSNVDLDLKRLQHLVDLDHLTEKPKTGDSRSLEEQRQARMIATATTANAQLMMQAQIRPQRSLHQQQYHHYTSY